MEKQTKVPKFEYKVASAFVWGGKIQKPGMKVSLTKAEAHGLIKRGKVEEGTGHRATAKKAADPKQDPGKAD